MRNLIDLVETASIPRYYHVTLASRVPSIQHEGLVGGKRRLWKNRAGGTMGERGAIYLFSDPTVAVRWAAHMEWEMKKPIVILTVEPTGELHPDPRIGLHAPMGTAWMTFSPIPPENITSITPLTLALKRQIVAGEQPVMESASGPMYFLRDTSDPQRDLERGFSCEVNSWFSHQEDAEACAASLSTTARQDPSNGMWCGSPEAGLSSFAFHDPQSFTVALERMAGGDYISQDRLAIFRSSDYDLGAGADGEDCFRNGQFVGWLPLDDQWEASWDDVSRLIGGNLMESSRSAPLYHFTTPQSLNTMVLHDALGLRSHTGGPAPISLTRDPRLPLANGLDIILVLDQQKLANRYRMTPLYGDSRTRWSHDPRDESEERVTNGPIAPLHQYLTAVYVDTYTARTMQQAFAEGRHKVEREYISGDFYERSAMTAAYFVKHDIPVYVRNLDDPLWHRRASKPVVFSEAVTEAVAPQGRYYLHVSPGKNLRSIMKNGLVAQHDQGNYSGFETALNGVYVTRVPHIIAQHVAVRGSGNHYVLAVVQVGTETFIDEDAIDLQMTAALKDVAKTLRVSYDRLTSDLANGHREPEDMAEAVAARLKAHLGPVDPSADPDLDEFLIEYCTDWMREHLCGDGHGDHDWWTSAKERIIRSFPSIAHPRYGDDYSLRIPEERVGFQGDTRIVAIVDVRGGQPRTVYGTVPPEAQAMISEVLE